MVSKLTLKQAFMEEKPRIGFTDHAGLRLTRPVSVHTFRPIFRPFGGVGDHAILLLSCE